MAATASLRASAAEAAEEKPLFEVFETSTSQSPAAMYHGCQPLGVTTNAMACTAGCYLLLLSTSKVAHVSTSGGMEPLATMGPLETSPKVNDEFVAFTIMVTAIRSAALITRFPFSGRASPPGD